MLADQLKRTSTCRWRMRRLPPGLPAERADVLNAKQHEREGNIVAGAGVIGAVTIATNMAGRGTDIILGGNPDNMAEDIARKRGFDLINGPLEEAEAIRKEARDAWQEDHERVVEVGGLHIVGTATRSRRIEPLRGRAVRRGPCSSLFFVAFATY